MVMLQALSTTERAHCTLRGQVQAQRVMLLVRTGAKTWVRKESLSSYVQRRTFMMAQMPYQSPVQLQQQ